MKAYNTRAVITPRSVASPNEALALALQRRDIFHRAKRPSRTLVDCMPTLEATHLPLPHLARDADSRCAFVSSIVSRTSYRRVPTSRLYSRSSRRETSSSASPVVVSGPARRWLAPSRYSISSFLVTRSACLSSLWTPSVPSLAFAPRHPVAVSSRLAAVRLEEALERWHTGDGRRPHSRAALSKREVLTPHSRSEV